MRRRCEYTGPLRHVTGFPGPGLLRVLRPTPTASAGDERSRRAAGCRPGGPPGWFPRSYPNPSTGSASSFAPATSPRLRRRPSPWPPDRRHQPVQEFSARHRRADARCYPAQIRQVRAGGSLEGRSAAGSSRTPSVSLAEPGPSGSAGPPRRCQDCFPPAPSSHGADCPQLQPIGCDRSAAVHLHTAGFRNASWRSMSLTHNSFGRRRWNLRLTRSSAVATPRSRFDAGRSGQPRRCRPAS